MRRDEAHQQGYKVITTIDRETQTKTEEAVDGVMTGQPDYLRAAMVSIDPHTGGVLAYHGGGTGTGLDYAQTPQEAGTSFAPFVAAAALQQGFRLDSPVDGGSSRMVDGIPFQNPAGVVCSPCTLRKALQQPVNTAMAAIAVKAGTDKVAEAAYLAGIPRELRGRPTMTQKPGESPDARIAIGSGSTMVRAIDMASAYATLAADGKRSVPYFVLRVEDHAGSVRYEGAPQRSPGLSPRVARAITEALTQDGVAVKPGVRAFGDSGASAKAWMVGYTPDIATAVWIGSDQLRAIKNKQGKDITAQGEPTVIWRATMDAYHSTRPTPAARPVPSR